MHMLQLARSAAVAAMLALTGTTVVAQTDEPLGLVYIGDSWLLGGLPLYADRVNEDIGQTLKVVLRPSNMIVPVTQKLEAADWDVLQNAGFVWVSIHSAQRGAGYCLDSEAAAPYARPPEVFRVEIEAFLDALTEQVDPSQVMVRVTLQAVLPHFKEMWVARGVVEDCTAGWLAINGQWREPAQARGIGVIDTITAWNGPDGLANAPDGYYQSDGVHLTAEGFAAAAELMSEVGYAPLAP